MTQLVLAGDGSPFDRIRRVDDHGEYWMARELMPLLGYEKWERFEDAIERARLSIANTGGDPDREASRRREAFGRTRQIGTDYRLSRYAAYLIAMNGDVRKAEVAAAQTYFAVRTREAETAPARRELSKLEVLEMALESERQRLLAVDRADRAEGRVLELAPKAAQADAHRAADGLLAIGDFANRVKAWAKDQHGVTVKHEDVWNFLGEIGLIVRGNTVRHNQPTAMAVERDFVRTKVTEYETNNHGLRASSSSRLTPAGEGWAWDRAVRRIAEHGSLKPTKALART